MIKKIKYWIRNFFGFSKIETNGFIGLLLVILIVLLTPIIFEFFNASTYSSSTEDKILLDSLVYQLEQQKEEEHEKTALVATLDPFPFNPNEADLEIFTQLGLSTEIGKRIINYRKAGGSFKIKSDFNKIYGLQQETYEQLYAYILLPENHLPPPEKTQKEAVVRTFAKTDIAEKQGANKEVFTFDINTCDTATLKTIYGIGPVLAERIIKYRVLIGGFIAKEQLSEVYGLKEEALKNLYEKTYIENAFIPEKIAINEADVKTMAAHPYIPFGLAKAVYAYRNQHGDFPNPEALLNIHILDSATFVKLKPYIAL